MNDLTDRQREIFTLIYETARDKGYQPTIREIGKAFGIKSPNGVMCHLEALTKSNWLRRIEWKHAQVVFLRRPDGTPFHGFQDKTEATNGT